MRHSILVTGGCGYIGSHVCRNLSQMGHHVVVLDNLSTGFSESLLSDEKLIIGNVEDKALLKSCIKEYNITSVMHFAASTSVSASMSNPVYYYQNNSMSVLNLLAVCAEYGVENFILSSTAAVYGSKYESPVSEENLVCPESVYGKSKVMAEYLVNDISKASGITPLILRYFNVAGVGSSMFVADTSKREAHLIKIACQAALGIKEELVVYGDDYQTKDGTGIRDYIHVEDIASAHTSALDYLVKGGKGGVFNCGYGNGFSVKEVISMIERVSGRKVPYRVGKRRNGDIAGIYADCNKIKKTLGWKPKYNNLEEIIRSAYNAEKLLLHIPSRELHRSAENRSL